MRLIVLSLKKDLNRLWPAAAVTWMMLMVLTNADRWRTDSVAAPMEGWMNPLLTFAWACLIALAVLEDPLVGTSSFWTTRPYRWQSLLSAKIAFAVLTIHMPLFLADLFVLSTHGFLPVACFSSLLGRQALFFAVLTLPSIGVACLVRNFAQFVIVAFLTAAGVAMLNGGLQSYPDFYHTETSVRQLSICLILAIAATCIVCIQYARRGLVTARIIALTTVALTAFLFAGMPPVTGYSVRGWLKDIPVVVLRPDGARNLVTTDTGDTVALPIEIVARGMGSQLHVPLVLLGHKRTY